MYIFNIVLPSKASKQTKKLPHKVCNFLPKEDFSRPKRTGKKANRRKCWETRKHWLRTCVTIHQRSATLPWTSLIAQPPALPSGCLSSAPYKDSVSRWRAAQGPSRIESPSDPVSSSLINPFLVTQKRRP